MGLTFIKLDIEIMNDAKVRMIRKMPDGPRLFELWIGVLCLAMKSGTPGYLEISEGIPFTSRMLSSVLDIPENTVDMGLATFEQLGMIEYMNKTILIINFEKHQELEKIEHKKIKEKERKQRYRSKIRQLSHGTGRGHDADGTQCPTIDLDKDTDVDKDKDIKKDKKPVRHKHGEYKHVLLTDTDRDKLVTEWGTQEFDEMVKRLDEYIETKGAKYKNHYLVLRTWKSKDSPQKEKPVDYREGW